MSVAATTPTGTKSPTWPIAPATPQQESAALDVATQIVTAWLGPNQNRDEWWQRVSAYVSNDAYAAYATVNPINIVPTQVTGPAHLVAQASSDTATVAVPVASGEYIVVLLRVGDEQTAGSWRMVSINLRQDAK